MAAGPRDFSVVQGAKTIGSVANLATDGTSDRLGPADERSTGTVSGGTTRVAVDDILIDGAMHP